MDFHFRLLSNVVFPAEREFFLVIPWKLFSLPEWAATVNSPAFSEAFSAIFSDYYRWTKSKPCIINAKLTPIQISIRIYFTFSILNCKTWTWKWKISFSMLDFSLSCSIGIFNQKCGKERVDELKLRLCSDLNEFQFHQYLLICWHFMFAFIFNCLFICLGISVAHFFWLNIFSLRIAP